MDGMRERLPSYAIRPVGQTPRHFGDETCRVEPIDNPLGPKVLRMSPE
jgi:hypothetical protein